MAFTAIDLAAKKDYISPNDPDPKNPTVWHLGAVDAMTWARIQDMTSMEATQDEGKNKLNLPMGSAAMEAVRYGLKGVDNFPGAKFKTKKLNRRSREIEVVSDEFIMVMPPEIFPELLDAIEKLNKPSEAEAKNSPSGSGSAKPATKTPA
jgi:hypothetical protein